MECGAQCVMMVSAPMMLELLADSLVILLTVDMEMLEDLGKANYNLAYQKCDDMIEVMSITHAAIVEEQEEFGWIMSTAIVIALDYPSAVILDGVLYVLVATVKMSLCNVPAPLLAQVVAVELLVQVS